MTVLVLLLFSNILLLGSAQAFTNQIIIPTYMVTTRGNLDHPIQVQGSGYHGNYELKNINTLLQTCPREIVIFVHGWHVTSDVAKEQLDTVKMSLENNAYNIPLIGYSWGSDIEWNDAKVLAKNEGPKVAQFISSFIHGCNGNSQIRLLGHSLGSRVILSSLHALNNMPSTANFKILSVNLMGAAVDDDEISMNRIDRISNPNPWWWLTKCTSDTSGVRFAYGEDIRKKVVNFYNFVDSEDNVLQFDYPCAEGGNRALGEHGQSNSFEVQAPFNYSDIYGVEREIKPVNDADAINGCDLGICDLGLFPAGEGDNHLGYMGFRNLADTNKLADDGAMNIVVDEWRNQ